MAVFTLTTGADIFSGDGNVDHFTGVPITINGSPYNGATSATPDTVNAAGGADHLYLGHLATGTYDGGTEVDTVHAYGDIDVNFSSSFTNFEIFDAAATNVVVNIASSHLNSFSAITGHLWDDGRVHLSVDVNVGIDFGAKMNSGTAGINLFVDFSLNSTYSFQGTSFSDLFEVNRTNASATISYFGNAGSDVFLSDLDGGMAKFFGGANSDTFVLFRNGAFHGQVSEINGGESAGDNDTIVSTSGNFTTRTITGIETFKGTLNTLTVAQAQGIQTFIAENSALPQLALKDGSFTVQHMNLSDNAPNGLALNTSGIVGGGEWTLTPVNDTWKGNNNAAETVRGGGGNDLLAVTLVDDDPEPDRIFGDAGNDKIEVKATSTPVPTTNWLLVDGGTGTNTLAGEGNLTGINVQRIQTLQFLGEIEGGLALFAVMLSYTGPTPDPDENLEMLVNGQGGLLDLYEKTSGLKEAGMTVRASTTSEIIIAGSRNGDNLTASAHNDTIKGNGGEDVIDGNAGKDTAVYSDKTSKVVVTLVDGSGTVKVGGVVEDTLIHIESVIGGTKGDKLTGDAKANVFTGGKGSDTVKGAGGADKFVFNAKLGASNVDQIADFKHNTDKLVLDDAIFKTIGAKLDAKEFYAAVGATKAHDKDDRIIYDTSTGKLFYDDDGNKSGGHAPILFAILVTKPLLDSGDFGVV